MSFPKIIISVPKASPVRSCLYLVFYGRNLKVRELGVLRGDREVIESCPIIRIQCKLTILQRNTIMRFVLLRHFTYIIIYHIRICMIVINCEQILTMSLNHGL